MVLGFALGTLNVGKSDEGVPKYSTLLDSGAGNMLGAVRPTSYVPEGFWPGAFPRGFAEAGGELLDGKTVGNFGG